MKSFCFGLLSVVAIGLAGCSPSDKNGEIDREKGTGDHSVEADQTPAKKQLDQSELNRLREIDLAFAMWYSHQSSAAVQLGQYEGVEFGAITFERDPQVVIQEQGANIRVVTAITDSEKNGLTASISYWCDQQLKAVNCLREVLGEARIPAVDKRDPALVLRQQEKGIDALKKEAAKILGYEYWPTRSESDSAPND